MKSAIGKPFCRSLIFCLALPSFADSVCISGSSATSPMNCRYNDNYRRGNPSQTTPDFSGIADKYRESEAREKAEREARQRAEEWAAGAPERARLAAERARSEAENLRRWEERQDSIQRSMEAGNAKMLAKEPELREAAERGGPDEWLEFARWNFMNWGELSSYTLPPHRRSEGGKWLRKAAEHNAPDTSRLMAAAYDDTGVPGRNGLHYNYIFGRNDLRAIYWIKRAAAEGSSAHIMALAKAEKDIRENRLPDISSKNNATLDMGFNLPRALVKYRKLGIEPTAFGPEPGDDWEGGRPEDQYERYYYAYTVPANQRWPELYRLAQEGLGRAQYELGASYLCVVSHCFENRFQQTDENYARARYWLTRAGKQGFPEYKKHNQHKHEERLFREKNINPKDKKWSIDPRFEVELPPFAKVPNQTATESAGRDLFIPRSDLDFQYLSFDARAGDARAQHSLASAYLEGFGTEIDKDKALEWLQAAAAQDYAPAVRFMGYMAMTGLHREANPKEARKYLEGAAAKGDADATFQLGELYASYYPGKQDFDKAADWYRKAYRAGEQRRSQEALFALGMRAYQGEWEKKKPDPKATLRYLEIGAELGSSDCMLNLGLMRYYGQGVDKDVALAIAWFRRASEAGSGTAAYQLAHAHSLGLLPENKTLELEYLALAARRGNSDAEREFGIKLITNPESNASEKSEGLNWLQRAVERNDANAANALGTLYARGEHLPQDDEKAVALLRSSAEAGYAWGQRNFAKFLWLGRAVSVDRQAALRLLDVSSKAGVAEAGFRLAQYQANGDIDWNQMPPAESTSGNK